MSLATLLFAIATVLLAVLALGGSLGGVPLLHMGLAFIAAGLTVQSAPWG